MEADNNDEIAEYNGLSDIEENKYEEKSIPKEDFNFFMQEEFCEPTLNSWCRSDAQAISLLKDVNTLVKSGKWNTIVEKLSNLG